MTFEFSPEQERQLKSEWWRDQDGFPHREAARVVVVDSADLIYLILGHDFSDASHRWWFTVGGGIAAGETSRDGAVRELREETGLVVPSTRLTGPVMRRYATFHFAAETRKQDEDFYLLRVSDAEREVIDSRRDASLTVIEQDLLDDFAWWHPGELEGLESRGEKVYPRGLAGLVAGWLGGWDGSVAEITES